MKTCQIEKNLVRLRMERGLTQEEVATQLSISNKTLSKWENSTSMPDLDKLIELACYFNVTTDALLGLEPTKSFSIQESLKDHFAKAKTPRDVAKTAFEVTESIFPLGIHTFLPKLEEEPQMDWIPRPTTNELNNTACYHYFKKSNPNNLTVLLLPNAEQFAWLVDPEQQSGISALLSFLSEPDVMRLCHFLHSTTCSSSITVDYLAKKTGLSSKRVKEIMETLNHYSKCRKIRAHMVEGEVTVYEYTGDGLILSILALAYEKASETKKTYYDYKIRGNVKMIGDIK